MRAYELPEWKEGKPIRRNVWGPDCYIRWVPYTNSIANNSVFDIDIIRHDLIYRDDWTAYVVPKPTIKAGQVWEYNGFPGAVVIAYGDADYQNLNAYTLPGMILWAVRVTSQNLGALLADSLEEYYAKKSSKAPI